MIGRGARKPGYAPARDKWADVHAMFGVNALTGYQALKPGLMGTITGQVYEIESKEEQPGGETEGVQLPGE